MGRLSEAVDDHEDSIVVVAGRQISDPIQGHGALGLGRDRKRGQETVGSMSHHLISRTSITAPHVFGNRRSKSGPSVVLR